jgi:hypothetical protein
MRADIHDGPEQHRSKQRPDTLLQDRIGRIDENLLHRTAGPYIWVKTGKALTEQMFSGLPPKADFDLRVNEYTPLDHLHKLAPQRGCRLFPQQLLFSFLLRLTPHERWRMVPLNDHPSLALQTRSLNN